MTTVVNPVWVYALSSVAFISMISFIGAAALVLERGRMQSLIFILVALAVGAMLGDVFLHLLPEAYERSGNSLATSLFCLSGIISFFILEKFLLWRHSHSAKQPDSILPVGYINLVADGLHNFIDGVLVGASYLVSIPIGIATTVAVCLHEIPQEIGDFGVLMHAGFSRFRALRLNFLSGLLAVAGAVLSLMIGESIKEFSLAVLSFTAGGFIYIAGSDLVPELQKEHHPRQAVIQLCAISAGIAGMLFLKLWN